MINTSVLPGEATEHEEQQKKVVTEEPVLVISLDTGETLQRGRDGRLSLGEYPIIQLTPKGLPTHLTCVVTGPDGAPSEHTIAVNDVLLVATEGNVVSLETEALWFSAYMYARSVVSQITLIFSETAVGPALEYAWGSQDLLKAITGAKEVFSLFPIQFPDGASLFAACTSLHEQISAIMSGSEQMDLVAFLSHVRGGQAFLDVLPQLQNAQLQLPALQPEIQPSSRAQEPVRAIIVGKQRTEVSIIRKEDEAERLHGEIVDNKNPLTQLYLAMILGSTSFLAIALQPNIAPFTACLLPLAGLSIAFKIAAYDLRPGQINFYLRRFLFSPWEIVRRILFDGSQPSVEEQAVLKEQNIVITESLLQAATALKPPFPDMQSTANRLAILVFEGAAIAVLIIRIIGTIEQRDFFSLAQVIVALIISSIATFYSFKVLKRKRVR